MIRYYRWVIADIICRILGFPLKYLASFFTWLHENFDHYHPYGKFPLRVNPKSGEYTRYYRWPSIVVIHARCEASAAESRRKGGSTEGAVSRCFYKQELK